MKLRYRCYEKRAKSIKDESIAKIIAFLLPLKTIYPRPVIDGLFHSVSIL